MGLAVYCRLRRPAPGMPGVSAVLDPCCSVDGRCYSPKLAEENVRRSVWSNEKNGDPGLPQGHQALP